MSMRTFIQALKEGGPSFKGMERIFVLCCFGRCAMLLFCHGCFFSVSYTSTLYMVLLEVASMQVALGVRKTFAFL